MRLLLQKGYLVDAVNRAGDTPLLSACAAYYPSPKVVEFLLSNGTNIAARTTKALTADVVTGDTPCKIKTYGPNIRRADIPI